MHAQSSTFLDSCHRHIGQAKKLLQQITDVKGPRTVDNTLQPYNDIDIELDSAGSLAGLYSNVHPDKAVRDQAEQCEQEVSQFATEMGLNRDLYQAIVAVDAKTLTGDTKRMHDKTVLDFHRSGVDKDDATRAKIKAIQEELVKITQAFERNIREDVRSIEIPVSGLKGLPQDYINSRKDRVKDGKLKITTDYPDYIPFMTYADDAALREKLWRINMARGYPTNEPVFSNMLAKRYELAQLLGYPNYAAYVVEDKMIKTPQKAQAFIDQIAEIALPTSKKEFAELLAEKQKTDPKATTVYPYEQPYLAEKIKTAKFGFKSQDLRPYFQFEKVREGLFALTGKLFGVRYQRVMDAPVWDPSVEVYDVCDAVEQKCYGRIFLDLHPRDNKFKHAAQFGIRDGVRGVQTPQGALVCNFPKPGKEPALMEHSEVVTFFHEFGHLLHHVFGGNQRWIRFSGTATEWDFVEAPSQFFEEWAWDPEVLQTFARDYKTGKVIPRALVKKMKEADHYGEALATRRQMFLAALSLNYYDKNPKGVVPLELLKTLQAKYSPFPYVDGTYFHLSFGHLEGYSAMYYTYMWSKVISKDLLSPFKKQGMMNLELARRYRDTVLVPGGSQDAAVLVEHFLGRPYSFDAFKEWLKKGDAT